MQCIFLYTITGLPVTVKDLFESPKEKSQGAKKERKGLLDILVLFIAWSFAAYYVGFFIVFLSLVLYCSLELPNAEWWMAQLFDVRNNDKHIINLQWVNILSFLGDHLWICNAVIHLLCPTCALSIMQHVS